MKDLKIKEVWNKHNNLCIGIIAILSVPVLIIMEKLVCKFLAKLDEWEIVFIICLLLLLLNIINDYEKREKWKNLHKL